MILLKHKLVSQGRFTLSSAEHSCKNDSTPIVFQLICLHLELRRFGTRRGGSGWGQEKEILKHQTLKTTDSSSLLCEK